MCRHEMGENEKLPEEPEEPEEEEEEEEEAEEEEDCVIPEFDDEAHALWVFRKTFQMLDDNLSIVASGEADERIDLDDVYWRANRSSFGNVRTHDDGYETA